MDDDVSGRLEARTSRMRRMVWVLTSGFVLVLAALAAIIFSGHAALLNGTWGQIAISAAAVALFASAMVTMGRYNRIRRGEGDGPRAVLRQTDSHQRAWRLAILLNVLLVFFALIPLPQAFPILRAAQLMPLAIGLGAFIAGYMLLLAVILSAGAGWAGAPEPIDDEFDSALRTRAMRFGYILAMLLLGAVLVVALWRPELMLTAAVWALYAGFAVPALYYLIADWRALRGGDG